MLTDSMGPLPQAHPRIDIVAKAQCDLADVLLQWCQRHDLTYAERLMLLTRDVNETLKTCVYLERRKDK